MTRKNIILLNFLAFSGVFLISMQDNDLKSKYAILSRKVRKADKSPTQIYESANNIVQHYGSPQSENSLLDSYTAPVSSIPTYIDGFNDDSQYKDQSGGFYYYYYPVQSTTPSSSSTTVITTTTEKNFLGITYENSFEVMIFALIVAALTVPAALQYSGALGRSFDQSLDTKKEILFFITNLENWLEKLREQ